MEVRIYQGRSAIIVYRVSSDVAPGSTFTFTLKRSRGGDVLLQTSNVNHDFDANTGEIELFDSDTVNLPLGTLLGELQADEGANETYVVVEPQNILVLDPLRDG